MNADRFVEKIEYILENYEKFSENARKFALENDWTNMAKKISGIYDKLI